MKLREFGFIVFELCNKNIDADELGHIVSVLSEFVEDWDRESDYRENKDWILEDYETFAKSKDGKSHD